MIDEATAIFLARLCRRRAPQSPELAAALVTIAGGRAADLTAVPHAPEICRLYYSILDLQKASNGIAQAYWLDQVKSIALQYAKGDGVYDCREEAAQEAREQEADTDEILRAFRN